MSDDFIRTLQGDLVEAMERYERHGSRRLSAGQRPRSPRPAILGRFAAAVAVLVAVVIAARGLAPAPLPVRPRVVGVLAIGGSPVDAAFGDGSLW